LHTTARPPPASGGCTRPYSDASPWNTPIGAGPAIHPGDATYIASLTPTLSSDPTQYTYPVYYADSVTPLETVSISAASRT